MQNKFKNALIIITLVILSGCSTSPKSDSISDNNRHSNEYATKFGANWHEFWGSPIGKIFLFSMTGRYPLNF